MFSAFVAVERFSNLIIYCQRIFASRLLAAVLVRACICDCLWVKTAIINEKSPWSIVIHFFLCCFARIISKILQLHLVVYKYHRHLTHTHTKRERLTESNRNTHKERIHINSLNLFTEIWTWWRLFSLSMKFIIIYDIRFFFFFTESQVYSRFSFVSKSRFFRSLEMISSGKLSNFQYEKWIRTQTR